MGWLTGWFRRRTETGTTETTTKAPAPTPLSGEAPDRRSTAGVGGSVTNAPAAAITPPAGAAAAAMGGAILLGAEVLHVLSAHPAAAPTTDPAQGSASHAGESRHDGGSEPSGSHGSVGHPSDADDGDGDAATDTADDGADAGDAGGD